MDKHIKHPSDIYKIGDSVNAVVLSIDAESKISLGVKQLETNPWDGIEENIQTGEKYNGTVSNIVQNGAYVLLENDIEGFLNVSDISWTRKVKNASDILKNDQKIDVVVLDVSSKDKRISLGLKQNEEDPWEKIDDIFQVDMKIRGKVLFVLDKGIIFLLENGFEAILPISKVEENDKYLFSINKDFDLLVNQINKENRKIVLSYNNNEPASEIEKSDDES